MAVSYIGVGSNIEPEKNVPAALHILASKVAIKAISTFYRSAAIGSISDDFYNGVIKIETDIEPRELKYNILRPIEESLGRQRSADKNAPRTIDLDILLYDNRVINDGDLILPDPDITSRAFVYLPLLELDPDLIMPDSGQKLADIIDSASDITTLLDFTEKLRKEINNN